MSVDVRRRGAVAALSLLPKSALSHLAGRVAGARLPKFLRAPAMRGYSKTFGVDLEEVREPLDSFESIQSFFTRELKDGARPLDAAPDAFVAPCDGAWGTSGVVEDGLLLQVKGRAYRLAELLGDAADPRDFEGGTFSTLYLSPRDYHRFHMPCSAQIVRASYLPGALWPVNRLGVEGVDALFARNERLCVGCRTEAASSESADVWIVAVGATMVGKTKVVFDDLETHVRGGRADLRDYDPPHELAKGAELGRFEFGSTLVVVTAPGVVAWELKAPGTPLRFGTRIGTIG